MKMSSKNGARDTSLDSCNGDGDSSRESGIDDGPTEAVVDAGRAAAEALRLESVAGYGESKGIAIEVSCAPVENFAGSGGEGGSFLPRDGDESRDDVKKQKGFDAVLSQERRRKEALQLQKQRRDEILDKIRQLEDSAYSDSETEDEMDFIASVRESGGKPQTLEGITEEEAPESMEVGPSTSSRTGRSQKNKKKQWRSRNRQAPCGPMLSEWLLEVPEDFEEMWLGVVCPVGKRCMVMASRGKTKIFSRSDQYLGSYKSLLPGGCKYNYNDTLATTNRARGVTILDCIWSQQTQTFYVLDMICWNSHSCVNCDTEYRQFFLHSKFSENLELLERSPKNPFPFKPLMYFSASETSSVLSSPILFPEDIDGALFVHKEAFYISETNPLCLWILLTQVESILKIYVTPELLIRQVKPKNLNSRKKQMKRQDGKQSQEMEVHQS